MYLVYQPEGSDEPKRWKYDPNKLMSAERESIERRTSLSYQAFSQGVVEGNSVCRRALLFTFLKRDSTKLRYEDVDFAWDELQLEFSRQEYAKIRATIEESMSGPELIAALAQLDQLSADAYDEGDPGPLN